LTNLLPHVVNGLSLGLLFALIALGFMLIVGVMEVINLAHGSLFALGAYVALYFIGANATPASYAIALFAAPIAVGAFGMLLELCMRRTYGRDPALRAAAHLRRGAGDRGADPDGVGIAGAHAARSRRDLRRRPDRRPHLREVPLLRLRLRRRR
jgi:hypothetical protein